MKYCVHCGKELLDEAVICPGCGCETGYRRLAPVQKADYRVDELSRKIRTYGIFWIILASFQILFFLIQFALSQLSPVLFRLRQSSQSFWFVGIIGVLNLISAIKDVRYSGKIQRDPSGIVRKFEPLAGAILELIWNAGVALGGLIDGGLLGGLICGVGAGLSIYYLAGIRGFVMRNRKVYEEYDRKKAIARAARDPRAGEILPHSKWLDVLLADGLITREEYDQIKANPAPQYAGTDTINYRETLQSLKDMYQAAEITESYYCQKRAAILRQL